jgi:uncharacterized membrane protein YdjX (TVP38/TMEM64 family)
MLVKKTSAPKTALFLKLAVLAGVVVAVGVMLWRGVDLGGLVERALAWGRAVGPVAFFAALAVLPAFGFPVTAFTLSAAPIFAQQLGLGWVIVLVVLSVGINIVLTYWLARYGLRPLVEGVVRRMGYVLPVVKKEDHLALSLLCRITPGPPFYLQSYLLGLAEVPFVTYLWVSWAVASVYSVALVVFGDSIRHGSGKVVFSAVCILVVISVGMGWVRRRMARKKLEAV